MQVIKLEGLFAFSPIHSPRTLSPIIEIVFTSYFPIAPELSITLVFISTVVKNETK